MAWKDGAQAFPDDNMILDVPHLHIKKSIDGRGMLLTNFVASKTTSSRCMVVVDEKYKQCFATTSNSVPESYAATSAAVWPYGDLTNGVLLSSAGAYYVEANLCLRDIQAVVNGLINVVGLLTVMDTTGTTIGLQEVKISSGGETGTPFSTPRALVKPGSGSWAAVDSPVQVITKQPHRICQSFSGAYATNSELIPNIGDLTVNGGSIKTRTSAIPTTAPTAGFVSSSRIKCVRLTAILQTYTSTVVYAHVGLVLPQSAFNATAWTYCPRPDMTRAGPQYCYESSRQSINFKLGSSTVEITRTGSQWPQASNTQQITLDPTLWTSIPL